MYILLIVVATCSIQFICEVLALKAVDPNGSPPQKKRHWYGNDSDHRAAGVLKKRVCVVEPFGELE